MRPFCNWHTVLLFVFGERKGEGAGKPRSYLPSCMDVLPQVLDGEATTLEQNGDLAQALKVRERALLQYQRVAGDPAPSTDEAKIKLCSCIVAYFEGLTAPPMAKAAKKNRSPTRKQPRGKAPSPAASMTRKVDNTSAMKSYSAREDAASISSSVYPHNASSAGQYSHSHSGDEARLLTATLTVQGMLAFAERLLSPSNTLPESQGNPQLIRVRSRVLSCLALVLQRQGRPRAAIPLSIRAYEGYRAIASTNGGVSTDVVEALLSLCTICSAAGKHRQALVVVRHALDARRQLAAVYSQLGEQSATSLDVLEAMCYHNEGVEEEYVGLQELALRSFGRGLEIALRALGPQHPMTQALRVCNEQLFVTVNYKHFYPDGRRPGERSTAFDDPDRALRQLNQSYLTSERHKKVLEAEQSRLHEILSHTVDPLQAVNYSTTQQDLSLTLGGSVSRSLLRCRR